MAMLKICRALVELCCPCSNDAAPGLSDVVRSTGVKLGTAMFVEEDDAC